MDAEVSFQEDRAGSGVTHEASNLLEFSGWGQVFCQNGSSSLIPKDHTIIISRSREVVCKKNGEMVSLPYSRKLMVITFKFS
jgi:hypothetical protein